MLVAVAVFVFTLILVSRQPKGLGVGWSATIGTGLLSPLLSSVMNNKRNLDRIGSL